jgi:hypothetical protein
MAFQPGILFGFKDACRQSLANHFAELVLQPYEWELIRSQPRLCLSPRFHYTGVVEKQRQILHPLKRIQDDSAEGGIFSVGPRSFTHQKLLARSYDLANNLQRKNMMLVVVVVVAFPICGRRQEQPEVEPQLMQR